jgi:hypothetical protein
MKLNAALGIFALSTMAVSANEYIPQATPIVPTTDVNTTITVRVKKTIVRKVKEQYTKPQVVNRTASEGDIKYHSKPNLPLPPLPLDIPTATVSSTMSETPATTTTTLSPFATVKLRQTPPFNSFRVPSNSASSASLGLEAIFGPFLASLILLQ